MADTAKERARRNPRAVMELLADDLEDTRVNHGGVIGTQMVRRARAIARMLPERTSTMPETPDLTERARATLTSAICTVTDSWDEPLDEVHDVPQIVNAVLAWAAQQSAAAERVSVSAEAVFLIEGTHHFHGTKCLCGFDSHGRARSMTEHITGLTLDALRVTR